MLDPNQDSNQEAGPDRRLDLSQACGPSLLRRLATMAYDLMLLAAVLVIAAALPTIAVGPLTGGDLTGGPGQLLFRLYLLGVILLYYGYFWTGGRQSLGMRAWRVLLVRADGGPLTLIDALRRFGFAALTLAPAGIGLWWVLFDRDGDTWYERLSQTRSVLLAKAATGPAGRADTNPKVP
ncbi:MAG: RDD family protein [Chromatiaceae bacterium]|nr:MAG: RDD family protein [Chromatiaceae bacterium]